VITALNKIDMFSAEELAALPLADYPHAVAIAAAEGRGLDKLLAKVQEVLSSEEDSVRLRVRIPYRSGELVQLFHERGTVEDEQFGPEGTELLGMVPRRFAGIFERYAVAAGR
jgi:GTP-binding protein HflX